MCDRHQRSSSRGVTLWHETLRDQRQRDQFKSKVVLRGEGESQDWDRRTNKAKTIPGGGEAVLDEGQGLETTKGSQIRSEVSSLGY